MNTGWTIVVVSAIAAAIGARLGMRRMVAAGVGTGVAVALLPTAGPALARWSAPYLDWEPWVRETACWTLAYVAVLWSVSFVAMRILNRGRAAEKPSLSGRLVGAAVAGSMGGVFAWLAVGNLAEIVVRELPAADASPVVAAIRRPFEVVRACRVLATVSGPEAEMLVERQDIRAVLDADSLDRLLRTPGVIRKISRAADGDWGALATLAADPAVKEVMNGPEFLARIQAVDVVAMAADIERLRADVSGAPNKPIGERRAPTPVVRGEWARRLAEDPEFRRRVAEEWLAEQPASDRLNSTPPRRPGERATDAEVEAYWRSVAAMLELADGPNLPAAWLPGFETPAPPIPTSGPIVGPATP
jgi:hypothetical protein